MFGKMVIGRMPNLTHRCNFAGGGGGGEVANICLS